MRGDLHVKKLLCMVAALMLALSSIAALAANEPIDLPIGDYETDRLTVAVYDNYYAAASYADPLPVLEWIEERTGIQIDWDVIVPSQYDEIMRVRLAAGEDLPDIVQIPNSYSNKGEVYKYAMQGVIIPIDDLIREHAPNLAKLIWEDMPELGEAFTAPDGHIYHIAQNFDGGNKVEVKGLLLRTDWLDALGLEMPETADDWYNVLKAFATQDPNGNGINDEIAISSFAGLSEYGYLATAFGLYAPATKYIDVDGTAVNQYEQPGFKDFLMFLNKLYEEGIMDPQYSTGDEAKLDAMAAMDILGCSAHYGTKAELWGGTASLAQNPNSASAEYHMVLSPADANGEIKILGRALTGFCYGITRDCENPELAIRWLDYIYGSDEGRDVMLYGLEGLTYELDENGNKVWTDFVGNNPDGLSVGTALRAMGAFPAQFTNRTVEFYRLMCGETVYQEGLILQDYIVPPFPQVMGTEDELDRIASLSADIDTYENEMIQKFIMGQESFDNFDSFLETVRAMGGDELTQIYQDQLDRYYGAEAAA